MGTNGFILHYDGVKWQQLESGTTTSVIDVWGHINTKIGFKQVLATVSYDWWSNRGDYKILSLRDDHLVDTLQWKWPRERPLMSIWFDEKSPIYVAGSGVAVYKDSTWNIVEEVPNYGMYKVRGSGWTNIFSVGAFGMFVHYNGSSWHVYEELLYESGNLHSVAVTENMVVAIGSLGNFRPFGIAITGKKRR